MRGAILRYGLSIGLVAWLAACGDHQGPGEIEGKRVPPETIAERSATQQNASRRLATRAGAASPNKQILFGDLHVHTTFSMDAFVMGLPILQGEGASPVANACDYARYCSALDFWSITDHAEGLTPLRWNETVDSINQCNAIAGDPQNPDTVAFLGWEWTQIGATREKHYGHKNVILHDYERGKIPLRPIHAQGTASTAMRQTMPAAQRYLLPLLDWPNRQYYFDLFKSLSELQAVSPCESGIDTRKLPAECSEGAGTPAELFEKLDQWGYESMVIPHGTTWGIYTPLGSSWDKQITATQHDPARQFLIEVFSGHGNSEEYRDFKDVDFDEQGNEICPGAQGNYEPCCWRAGEIIRSRCDDPKSAECQRRVTDAKTNFLRAGVSGRTTIEGASVEDWHGCGTCPDCFQPAFNYRPKSSVQYIMALSNFDKANDPMRFHFGFIASSDNHSARPGTGYKEYGRLQNTEARGAKDETWFKRAQPFASEPKAPESRPPEKVPAVPQFNLLDFERAASFFMTGGLVAVHAEGRDRDSIWQSLKRKEVYATSGPRILMWFDLLNGPTGTMPMGSEAHVNDAPHFRVRAAGSFKQKPGCPDVATSSLTPQRLARLCHNECYNPSDERYLIKRVEVVRIRPQARPGEPMKDLIDDPWLTLPCDADPNGCVVEFSDPELLASGREAIYYARAIQEETSAVNANGERCKYDDQGRCIAVEPCFGDYRTAATDDCLVPTEERAWSSPIFVNASAQ